MTNKISNNSIYDITIRLFILVLITAWCLMIMVPFVSIILWSIILAMAIYPLHKVLADKMGGRKKLASFIIVFSILAVIFIPTWLLIDKLIVEVKDLKAIYDEGTLSIPPPTEKVKDWPIVGEKLYDAWYNASVNLEQTIMKYQDQLTGFGKKLAKGILSAAGGVIQIMAALIIAGILLFIGGIAEGIRKFFRKLAGDRGDEFADVTMKTVANVVKGILGVALILAILHGILLMVAGVPYAGIWTLLIFVLAVLQIPLFIVTLPIIIYFFATKELVPAIIWTALMLVVGMSDNILRPILLGKGAPVPMLVIFIGVIGGFILSGFIGLFTGAIVMSIGYKLFIGWINSNNEAVAE
jgi:predicted PurR-regulated permease PerM